MVLHKDIEDIAKGSNKGCTLCTIVQSFPSSLCFQHVLEHGSDEDKAKIVAEIRGITAGSGLATFEMRLVMIRIVLPPS